MEETRLPVGRAAFKAVEGRETSLVGSTPTLFRHFFWITAGAWGRCVTDSGLADMVLVGGGHAHVEVLRDFAMRPEPGIRLTLLTEASETVYSGMIPGYLSGHYVREDCTIDLRPLAIRARARIYHAPATGLDLTRRCVLSRDRPPIPFDILSLDIGSRPALERIPGAAEHAIPVKPIARFLDRWAEVEARAASWAGPGPFRLVVIGGGAGGVEVAMALRERLTRAGTRLEGASGVRIALVTDTDRLLPDHAKAVARRTARALARRGIMVVTSSRVVRVENRNGEAGGAILTEAGARIPFDAAIAVTPAGAWEWLRETGLALDARGFIRVDDCLRSISHPFVFAAGDTASLESRALPKAGVYAVRQGPALARSLRRVGRGEAPLPYEPQRRILALLSTARDPESGKRGAIASWGPVAAEGPALWRLKDWIDRRWMRMYQHPAPMEDRHRMAASMDEGEMRCGGCGAKISGEILARVLGEAAPDAQAQAGVLLGLGAPDDAAVIEVPAGKVLVQSVDQFRTFIDDPYLFGRIAALHALNDLYAMGAIPHSALLAASLPFGPPEKVEADLRALLAGAVSELGRAGAALVGGHTGEMAELALGLTVNGLATAGEILHKGGLAPGHVLVLTKPLGTGALFAADMRGAARGRWIEGAFRHMLASNEQGAAIMHAHGAAAATDVSGFGLAGHLLEMLEASGMRARLHLDAVPILPGAADVIASGIESTLAPANRSLAGTRLAAAVNGTARLSLLFDPQTAGGLLFGIGPAQADDAIRALREAGYEAAAAIGDVTGAAEPGSPLLEIR